MIPSERHPHTPRLLVAAIGAIVLSLLAGPPVVAQGGAAHPAASSPAPVTAPAASPASPDRWANYHKPADAVLRRSLTPIQYNVTQLDATERPFANAYWDNHAAGIYVDVVSGEPLFSSLDKYESGTGWPSFTKPLEPANVRTREDRSLPMEDRTELHSAHAGSHLGHVFDDGPAPTGLRYCMNSAAMRFIPVDSLAAEGYGKYLALFKK